MKAAFMHTGTVRNTSEEILLCNFFKVRIKFSRGIVVKEVKFLKPQPGWIKVNIDGAAIGQPGKALCGGIFMMCRGFTKGCFAMSLGTQTSLYAEIMGFILAIELAKVRNWFPLWVETDSTTLMQKVSSISMDVPWKLRVRWRKCLEIVRVAEFKISHIFREGNRVADKMAAIGLGLSGFKWWVNVPNEAFSAYRRNINNVTEFRISG